MSTGLEANGKLYAKEEHNGSDRASSLDVPVLTKRSRSPRSPNRRSSRSRSRSRSRGHQRGSARRRERSRSGSRGRGSRGERHKMMYISNIPYEVRWMELKDLIREKAGDVSFVEMIEKDGKSKGCAVVEFKTREGAVKCLETMHRLEMGDRRLVVKEISDPDALFRRVREETGVDFMANKSGGNRSVMSASTTIAPFGHETYGLSPAFLAQLGIEGPLCNRVFVANLPYNVSSSKLKEVFSLAGQVTDVDLQLDKDGKSKGLAIIEYFHPIESVQAISMLHHQRFFDRVLTVKMDRFDKTQETRRPGELPLVLVSVGMGLGANGTPLTNIAQLVASGNFGPTSPFLTPAAVQMASRISSSVSSSGVAPFLPGRFTPPPPLVNDYPMRRCDLSPPSPATGHNRMMTSTSSSIMTSSYGGGTAAAGAPSMGGLCMFSSRRSTSADVSTDFDYFRERDRERDRTTGDYLPPQTTQQQPQAAYSYDRFPSSYSGPPLGTLGAGTYDGPVGATSHGSIGTVGDFDRYGHAGGRPGSPMINRPARPLRSILIRNLAFQKSMMFYLPLDYSWQTLRDRMRGFGEVEFADIIQPGAGKIRFKTAASAEKAAVSLHGMLVEGRPITVDLVAPD